MCVVSVLFCRLTCPQTSARARPCSCSTSAATSTSIFRFQRCFRTNLRSHAHSLTHSLTHSRTHPAGATGARGCRGWPKLCEPGRAASAGEHLATHISGFLFAESLFALLSDSPTSRTHRFGPTSPPSTSKATRKRSACATCRAGSAIECTWHANSKRSVTVVWCCDC